MRRKKGAGFSSPGSCQELLPGLVVDIRALEAMSTKGKCEIILYFEEDLAYNSTYEEDLKNYASFPEHERPFINIGPFLSFQRDMNPLFDEALDAVPFGITIISKQEMEGKTQVKGLLPFLEEMDLS
jgi:hypothetical protein